MSLHWSYGVAVSKFSTWQGHCKPLLCPGLPLVLWPMSHWPTRPTPPQLSKAVKQMTSPHSLPGAGRIFSGTLEILPLPGRCKDSMGFFLLLFFNMLLKTEVDSGNQYRTTLPTLYPNTHIPREQLITYLPDDAKGIFSEIWSVTAQDDSPSKGSNGHPRLRLLDSIQQEWNLPFPDHPPFFMGTSSPL